ncbi:hypothetical protein [Halosegnis longus]|uniref:hypothetical protein n=1 Tax=Halosegnis longus TaxID=2216012 RepID=UPI00129D606F|nr:hypothetical protein [Halosegnis longus]
MTSSKSGKNYETRLAKDIYERSDHEIVPMPAGYSGNHDIPAPDVYLYDGERFHVFELKKTSKDRLSILFDPDDRAKDDIHQLMTFASQHPGNVVPYVGVRFDNRQLVLAKLWGESDEERMLDTAAMTAPTGVNVTQSNNLSFSKPETRVQDVENGWPSAVAGNDAGYLLRYIGYE